MESDKTLGIDLGTNSLGWAILDNITGDILDKGVLVFPEGIDPANDTLETPAAIRRAARAGRRMKFRRKMRKWILLKLLIENGMTPLKAEELEAWRKEGKYPVGNKAFIAWLKSSDTSNPYKDRANAAGGKVDKEVLGRALYHLAQRRGFKSSRKDSAGSDEEQDKERSKVKGDIAALTKEIAAAGCKTLGQYFCKVIEDNKNRMCKERVRKRYTGRLEHYEAEFGAIMDAQGIAPESELRKKLHDAIFYQRPLRSQKHLVGACPLETQNPKWKKAKCQIAHPAFEEFRMRSFVNNLSFEDENGARIPLTQEDREVVCGCFARKSNFKFGVVAKKFASKFKKTGYKFHYYSDNESLAANSVTHQIDEVFNGRPHDKQKIFDALTFFDDSEKLLAWIHKHFPELNEEECAKLASINPKEGNANYSLKAIKNILPFLREGYKLYDALLLAKLPDLIPDWANNKETVIRHLEEIKMAYHEECDNVDYRRAKREFKGLLARYKDYFAETWGWGDKEWSRLYINREGAYPKQTDMRLPKVELGMIRNPLVQRSMTTLRRMVNFLADHGKIDLRTTIRIELAREVNDYATRQALKRWNKIRETMREEARSEIIKQGVAPTEDAIDRYVLWTESNRQCLYTGKAIGIAELLSGNSFDIEHTIPRSLSGDDSLANKTICDAQYNREVKQGRIPAECANYEEIMVRLRPWEEKEAQLKKDYDNQRGKVKGLTDPGARSNARIKALTTKLELDYWRDKIKRFKVTAQQLKDGVEGLGGFKKRQLVDSGIMSSHAVELLKSVYPLVYTVNGQATAFARKAWGIQGDEAKDRSEHTHHAKDAMVIAVLTPKRFNDICTALKDDGRTQPRPCDVCPEPYDGFAEKVRKATGEILVKHILRQTTLRQSMKRNVLAKSHANSKDPSKMVSAVLSKGDAVRGQLHKETFYGCIQKPNEETTAYVVRKPLIGPVKTAKAMVDKIVDPAIRKIVEEGIARLEAEGKNNIEPNDIKMPSGVPINKVRIYAHVSEPKKLRAHTIESAKDYKNPYYVESGTGSNFRLALFNLNGKWTVKPDNSLAWAQNHKRADYVPYDKQEGFVGYVMPGSMALTHDGDKIGHLYKVVKFAGNGQVTLRLHSEARPSVVLEKVLGEMGKNKKGESKIDFTHPHEMLLVSPNSYCNQMWFEGIHFKMMLDGTIKFLDKPA